MALPTDVSTILERSGDDEVPADKIEKYTVDFFRGKETYRPPKSTCVFYTYNLSDEAQEYAEKNEMTTIWDVWPCEYYKRDQIKSNPLRDILKDESLDARTYFEHMSQAYAELCDVYAIVLTDDPEKVPATGIWGRVEQPTLEKEDNRGGRVDKIDAANPKGENILRPTYWTRPDTDPLPKRQALERRQRHPERCFKKGTLNKLFNDIDW